PASRREPTPRARPARRAAGSSSPRSRSRLSPPIPRPGRCGRRARCDRSTSRRAASSPRRHGSAGSVSRVIDLRSDTVTKPTAAMLAAMAAAEVGDEQYREDPTVDELQRRTAALLGQEAALFLPTATMANQVALRTQTSPGSLLLAEERTHVLIYEAGGPAIHSGLVMR